MQIAQRLEYVAEQEGIPLTKEGSALLARLADGGLRDALSLLDQCAGGGQRVDEQAILDALGLAGSVETANLMGQLAARDTAAALDTLGRLYANGKDVGTALGELSSLARDLLLRKTAPQGGAALMAGGYDEATLRRLGGQLSSQRLLLMLTQLQATLAGLSRSGSRRTDAELCLIRLSDETLDDSAAGLSARIARLEELLAQGVNVGPASPGVPAPKRPDGPPKADGPTNHTPTSWEDERPPLPEEPPDEEDYVFDEPAGPSQPSGPAKAPTPPAPPGGASPQNSPPPAGDSAFWPSFAAGLRGKVPPTVMPYLNNPAKVAGVRKNGQLTLWVDSEFTRSMLNKPSVLDKLAAAAEAVFGERPQVSVVTGAPPPAEPAQPPAPVAEKDPLDDLMSFGGLDNITIQ